MVRSWHSKDLLLIRLSHVFFRLLYPLTIPPVILPDMSLSRFFSTNKICSAPAYLPQSSLITVISLYFCFSGPLLNH